MSGAREYDEDGLFAVGRRRGRDRDLEGFMRGRVLDDSEEEDEARPAPLPLKPTMGLPARPCTPSSPLCSFDSFSFTRDCPPPMSLVQPHSLFISQGIASLLCTPHISLSSRPCCTSVCPRYSCINLGTPESSTLVSSLCGLLENDDLDTQSLRLRDKTLAARTLVTCIVGRAIAALVSLAIRR